MNSTSLLVRNNGIKLDYTHCGVKGNTRFAALSGVCQRCGTASETSLCPDCQKHGEDRGSALGGKSGWEQLIKNVTVSGCDVLVNGKVVRTGANYVHAQMIEKSLNKEYALHNLECIKHIRR